MPSQDLFDEFKKTKPRRLKTATRNRKVDPNDPLKGQPGIVRDATLMRVLENELDEVSLSAKQRKEVGGYRTRWGDASWGIQNLLGKVSEEIWLFMIQRQLGDFVRYIQHRQPNGDWQLSEWAASIEADATGNLRIWLVTKWTDMNNDTDMRYRGGHPVNDVNVNVQQPQVSDELLAMVKAQQGGGQNMDKMLKLLEAQVRLQAATAGVDISDLVGDEEEAQGEEDDVIEPPAGGKGSRKKSR